MKKYSLVGIIISIVATCSFAAAQVVDEVSNPIDCAVITHALKLGSRDANTGGDVTLLQTYLAQANYLGTDPTGYFGRATYKAVQAFQSANGITPQGNVGPYTRAKIKEVSCQPGEISSTQPDLPTVTSPTSVSQPFSIVIPDLKGDNSLVAGNTYTISFGDTGITTDSYSVYLDAIKGVSTRTHLGTAYQANRTFTFTIPAGLQDTVGQIYQITFNGKGGAGGSSAVFSISNVSKILSIGTATINEVGSNQINIELTGFGFKNAVAMYLNNCSSGSPASFSNSDASTGTGYEKSFFFSCAQSGSYARVYLKDAYGASSNVMSVYVPYFSSSTVNTSVPKVEFMSAPTVGLQYDAAGKESLLVGKAVVKITTGNSPITLLNNSVALIVQFGNNGGYAPTLGATYSAVGSISDGATIPANTEAIFTIKNTAKAGQLFAGVYSLLPAYLSYIDGNGMAQNMSNSSFRGMTTSNLVTIIGETSPSISQQQCDGDTSGVTCSLFGVRFNESMNYVTVDGVTKSYPSTGNGTLISFKLSDFGITSPGTYSLQISSLGALSNKIGMYIGSNVFVGSKPVTTPVLNPSIISFTQTKASTVANEAFTVAWSSSNALSCVFDVSTNNGSYVPYSTGLSGSLSYAPSTAGTHTGRLTCIGATGSTPAVKTLTHTVTAPTAAPVINPTISSFTQTKASTVSGETFAVSWSTLNTSACTFEVSTNGGAYTYYSYGTAGSVAFSTTVVGTHTGRLSCTGANGSTPAVQTLSHTVTAPATTPVTNPSISSFTQSKSATLVNESFNISWGSLNASACNFDVSTNGGSYVPYSTGLSGNLSYAPATAGTYVGRLTCTGASGSTAATQTITHTVVTPTQAVTNPVISSFAQTRASTPAGEAFTVSWSSSNAAACTFEISTNGGAYIYSSSGTTGSVPFTSTTIGTHTGRLTCTGATGSTPAVKTLTHTVTAPTAAPVINPTITSFSQTKASTVSGEAFIVSWSSSAAACTFDISTNGGAYTAYSYGTSGNLSFSTMVAGTHVGRLTCTGATGSTPAVQTLSHTVVLPTPPAPTPVTNPSISSFTQSKSATLVNESFNISWGSLNATACNFDVSTNGGSYVPYSTGLSGNLSYAPAAAGTHIGRLTCTGASGSTAAVKTLTHTVTAPAATPVANPSISSFTQTKASTVSGEAFTVSWSSSNANVCTFDVSTNGGVYTYYSSGVTGTVPFASTAVGTHIGRLTCTGASGSTAATQTLTHTVSAPVVAVPVVTLSQNPSQTTTSVNTPFTVDWSSTGANSCVFDISTNGGAYSVYSMAISGSMPFAPTAAGTYTGRVSCTNSAGVTVKTIMHTVTSPTVVVPPPSPAAPPTIAPTVTLTQTPAQTTTSVNTAFTVNWSSTGADRCTFDISTNGGAYQVFSVGTSGSAPFFPPVTAGSYIGRVTCSNTSGTTVKTISHNVVAGPVAQNSGAVPMILGSFTMCLDIPYNLHRGAENPSVTNLQNFLVSQEMLTGPATGFYGDKTIEAVKMYQGSKDMPETGMVYEFTRAAIKSDTCGGI